MLSVLYLAAFRVHEAGSWYDFSDEAQLLLDQALSKCT